MCGERDNERRFVRIRQLCRIQRLGIIRILAKQLLKILEFRDECMNNIYIIFQNECRFVQFVWHILRKLVARR